MKEIELKLTDQTQLTAQLAAQLAAERLERLESEKKIRKMEEEMAKKDWLAENNGRALRSAGARERRLRLRIPALSERRGKFILEADQAIR